MPSEANRPYFNSSILQIEALFDEGQTSVETLEALDYELSYRTTARAGRLRSKISDLIATRSIKPANRAVDIGSSIGSPATPTKMVETFPNSEQPPQSAQRQEKEMDRAPPPSENLGDLPPYPTPKGANEPASILATWIALEALSPQTYRRPEDLSAGDRRCVADLSTGHVPWQAGERSRPKKQLYYQVILGSIPIGRATEDLVKVFGNDEERSQRAREKAAIGAILVDKEGIVLEENGIAISSFAWALPLALKLNLGALGAWPKVESKSSRRSTASFAASTVKANLSRSISRQST